VRITLRILVLLAVVAALAAPRATAAPRAAATPHFAAAPRAAAAVATPHASAAGRRDSAAAAWRARHPWPPWWALPETYPGPPMPGVPFVCGPPAPSAAPEDLSLDYAALAHAAFTSSNRIYASARVALRIVGPLATILFSLLFLFSGLSAALRNVAHAASRRRYVRVLVYLALYSALGFVLLFPLVWFEGYALAHRFWLADEVKGALFEILFLGVIPLLALAYRTIEKWPRAWWAWFALASLPLIAATTWLGPVVVEPAFNRFRPLADERLRGEILALSARAGIPGSQVLEADRSAQTNTLNAFVSGIGSSHRIVFWDTTLRELSADELLFVTGHEIGHYRLGHVERSVLLTAAASVVGLLLLWALARAAMRRFGAAWDVTGLHDIASLPLLVALMAMLSMAAEPAANAVSRAMEHDADVYGLEITRLNDAAARAFVKMGTINKSDPDPPGLLRALLYSHPTLVERIRFAESYRPWERGGANRLFIPRP
jgi:Zn-dependent protease with chaperone function